MFHLFYRCSCFFLVNLLFFSGSSPPKKWMENSFRRPRAPVSKRGGWDVGLPYYSCCQCINKVPNGDKTHLPRWWFQIFFIFHPEPWGNDFPFDDHIFQMGWNHQLVTHSRKRGFLEKMPGKHLSQEKKSEYFPLNPVCLIGIVISWLIIIPTSLGSFSSLILPSLKLT